MTTRLVIAEKPSVARDIASALTKVKGVRFTTQPWGFTSPDWRIASARGHLVAEAPPEAYNPAWKKWALDTLPIIPNPPKFTARNSDAAALLATLTRLINDADVDEVVNACDAGREGELIFKLIYAHSRATKPVTRAWFSSMTAQTLCDALDHLRPDRDMVPLEAAARARAEADWIIGINATRAATVRLGGRELLSLGRVQTPTLALVVARDLAIAGFSSQDYWHVRGTFTFPAAGGDAAATLTALHQTRAEDDTAGQPLRASRFDDDSGAQAVCARVGGQPARVVADTCTPEVSKPPHLFDLTTLQKEANKLYGFSAARTLTIAQACYEEHKILTYPRTDAAWLPTDMAATVPGLLTALAGQSDVDSEVAATAGALAGAADVAARVAGVVDDSKVTDHHAIIPTGAPVPSGLPTDAARIYDLVVRRLVAALSDKATYDRRTIEIFLPGTDDTFRTSGRTLTAPGWTEVYPPKRAGASSDEDASDDEAGDATLPALPADAQGTTAKAEPLKRSTKPPKHYTDATLLAAMSTAGKLVDDELAAAMKDSGLGTPATRAATIERLIKVGYLARSGRYIKASQKAVALIGLMDGHTLTSPEVTGKWEHALKKIEQADPQAAPGMAAQFTAAIHKMAASTVEWFRTVDDAGFTTDDVLGPCPVPGCGGRIVARKQSWSCDSWRSKEEPGCGWVCWRKQGGKNLTRAQALTILNNSDGTVVARVPRTEIADCPTPGCDGKVLAGAKAYGCSTWTPKTPGCGFVLFRNRKDGAVLDDASARGMIAAGVNDRKAEREKLAPCPKPRCKGYIVETERAFSCDSWRPGKKGCGTTLWKTDRAGNVLVTADTLAEKLAELG